MYSSVNFYICINSCNHFSNFLRSSRDTRHYISFLPRGFQMTSSQESKTSLCSSSLQDPNAGGTWIMCVCVKGGSFGCHNDWGVLLAFSVQEPWILNDLQCSMKSCPMNNCLSWKAPPPPQAIHVFSVLGEKKVVCSVN